jgi:hypothetical protein
MAIQTEITMDPITAGTFCWNEIATRDDCCGMDYTVFKKEGHPVGWTMLMDDNRPTDTPSH